MQITKTLRALLAIASLSVCSVFAMSAQAATYQVEQSYSGTLVQTETLIPNGQGGNNIFYQSTVDFTPTNLISGDASLFSSSLSTITEILYNVATDKASCAGECTFVETLKNGDTFFGTLISNGASFLVPSTDPSSRAFDQIGFTGSFLIKGGTGLFAGATGFGTYSGVDDYTTMTETLTSKFTVTTVPEPKSAALLLVGLGLMGVITRRKPAA
ncbi:PEP-CTERM sorting domain-containing protein [Methylophilus glucosoxydans]|uniref:PEP-CTERM sorting domain-containing protein n=1 Tax=Methylophilus glucosoxydans TaxID=752553 RepID=A0ABW3GG90_9PROT